MVIRRSIQAALGFLRHRQGSQVPPEPLPSGPPVPPPGVLPILSARDLLRSRREAVNRLEELAGTTGAHFERYYLVVLARFAAWAQELPASEAHHHAYPGGLLDHGLEVAVAALRIRQGYLLPPGAPPEEAVLKKDLWTYAVFTLALLHDSSKPAVDQTVTVHGDDRFTWPWNPWAGALGDDPRARGYAVAFRRQRDYRRHQQASLLLAPRLVTAEGLAWLASDPAVFGPWLAYAAGDTGLAGVFAEILAKADGESVARSLGAGAAPGATPQSAVPLHEKLRTALRHLIDSGELPMNHRGGAGFRVGDDLWLLSKRVPDALRAHLLATGHAGIPADNSRLFDVLQDFGLLVPNAEGRAVWRGVVRAEGHADTLTLLRIPIAHLWADPETAPAEFTGILEPAPITPSTGTQPVPAEAALSDETAIPVSGEGPLPEARGGPPAPVSPDSPRPGPCLEGEPAARPRTTATPAPRGVTPPITVGRQFLDWLIGALREGRLEYNSAKARVHVVPEGVLLTSPGLFRDYAEATGTDFEAIQRSFQKLKLHRVTSAGLNVHQYAVAGSGAVIKGFLLPEPVLLFGEIVPAPNSVLKKL